MSEANRARRRHDRWRMVEKAKRLIRLWDGGLATKRRANEAARIADNMAYCSCLACRQHRREFAGPTMRERRHIESEGK